MKVVILAGGYGTRISEESELKPKPMVEIGNKPILWHIMKSYSAQGFNDFVILCGYKGWVIKEYFANYFLHQSDIQIDVAKNSMEVLNNTSENWKVSLIETGLDTMTGGRIKRAQKYLQGESFMLTYGDGVSDVDVKELLAFHKGHGKTMTLTGVQAEGRFGALDVSPEGKVSRFKEKPKDDGAWINGGFFVCEPKIFDLLEDDNTILERSPLEKLSEAGQLMVYRHKGFWQCMDTLRDKNQLNDLWKSGRAPWKKWS